MSYKHVANNVSTACEQNTNVSDLTHIFCFVQSSLQVQKCIIKTERFRFYKETCNRCADEDLAQQQALFREEMNAQWREIQQTLSRQSHTEIVRQHKQMAAEITKLSFDIDGKMVKPCLFPPTPGMVVHNN